LAITAHGAVAFVNMEIEHFGQYILAIILQLKSIAVEELRT
jgi:hypothetical protein